MAVRIVDADIRELRKSARRGRSRSPEVLQLIQAVQALKPGQAKALVSEGDVTVKSLRTRLGYAARAAGVKLRVVVAEDRVLFALRRGAGGARAKGISARRQAVLDAASKLVKSGKKTTTAEEVLAALKKSGATPEVARPLTMIGAVLRRSQSWKRVGKNKFEYRG